MCGSPGRKAMPHDMSRRVARKLGVATVIAGGGDGTINEVSTALIQCEGDNIPRWEFCH